MRIRRKSLRTCAEGLFPDHPDANEDGPLLNFPPRRVTMPHSCPSNSHRLEFLHRTNPNGSYDSLCPRCFHVIANERKKAELALFEALHTCSTADGDNFFEAVLLMLTSHPEHS
jgi:hypothetical protein